MTNETKLRPPVFIRRDGTTDIEASVVAWGGRSADESLFSVYLKNGKESVLINAEDWPTLVSCINSELECVR